MPTYSYKYYGLGHCFELNLNLNRKLYITASFSEKNVLLMFTNRRASVHRFQFTCLLYDRYGKQFN